ncbi:MAG: SagB family peptide dehydrogenase [Pseudomonadota bacterium]
MSILSDIGLEAGVGPDAIAARAARAAVLRYHQATKHRLQAYARGPETLDWDAQPAPFRRYDGAPSQPLPLAAARYEISFRELHRRLDGPAAAPDAGALGALLQLSFAISAWKSNGVDRWALRCNPSSGNLHPSEAYLIADGIAGLADGVHHYRAGDHALEQRAAWQPPEAPAARRPALYLGLSSVIWREAWKYGERAFRYCQLDIGHAVACVAYAAGLLGWRAEQVRGLTREALAQLLGLDRAADFAGGPRADVEREEPELLLALHLSHDRDSRDAAAALAARSAGAVWCGRASPIDPHPMYRWPIIDEVVAATACVSPVASDAGRRLRMLPPLTALGAGRGAVETILGRRSGQRYDGRSRMRSGEFFHLLDALLERPQPPWRTLHDAPRIALLLFVHRVEGLAPGLYLLLRDSESARELPPLLKPELRAAPRVAGLEHLDLRRLAAVEPPSLQRVARSLCCHQDIAAAACFTLAMLVEFEAPLQRDPAQYRTLLRHAGLLGQILYLEAEALGYRGTGIGCHFDDALHEMLGFSDARWQSLYHFAIGVPVPDTRIETSAAYAQGA